MPGPTAGSAVPVGRARTLAQVYRHFGEVDAAETSPLYERVAVALSESDEALRAIEAAPARKRHPTVILAALHDLALAGAPGACRGLCRCGRRRCRWRGDRHAAANDRLGRGHRRATADADQRDRTLRRAVSGHCRGGAPGRRECGWTDRRGLFGWAQSQCRSRWHHLQQRTIAGPTRHLPCSCRLRSWETGPSRRGRMPRGRRPGRR